MVFASTTNTDRVWPAGLLVVVALAIFLRFEGLGEPSLWLDEILHVAQAQQAATEAADGPWHAWLTGLSVDRENGPLYYATQLVALELFEGELAVRLVPALAGVAAVLALCFVGATVTGSRWTGLAAGLLLAVSPLHVYYAREGRPYAAVMLAATLLLLLAFRYRERWARVAAYPVAIGAAYLGAVAAPVLVSCSLLAGLSWWLFRRRGRDLRCGHLALAAGLALVILPMLFPQVQGLDRVSGEAVKASEHSADVEITRPLSPQALDRLAASLTVSGLDSGSTSWLSWLLISLAFWGGVALLRRDGSSGLWVVGMCLLPIAGWVILLQAFDHWYNVRYTSSGLPAFLVLVAAGVVDLGERVGSWARRGRMLLQTGVIAGLLVSAVVPSWRAARTEPWQKPAWREVVDLLGTMATDDEVIVARDAWSHTCVGFYLDLLDHPIELFAADFDEDRARAIIDQHKGAFVVAAGYRKGVWLRDWLGSLVPILSRQEANLRLFYAPDFRTLFSASGRGDGVLSLLERSGHPVASQEFTGDEALLGPGWSSAEVAPGGRTFRWASAERATIAVAGPKDVARRELRLLARPFPSPNLPPQRLTVMVNAQPVADAELAPGWNELTFPYVSERAVDLVRFEFAWLQSPRGVDPSSPDGRTLAVAFDWAQSVAAGGS